MISDNSAIFVRVSVVAALFLASAGCGAARGPDLQEVPPGIAFEQMDFRVYRGSTPSMSGQAERASLRRDTTAVEGQTLRVRLPGRPGEPEVVLAAPEGRGSVRERWFEVWGGAVLTQGAVRCQTERARYADGLIQGDRPVQIQGQGFSLSGPGFLLDPRAGSVRIRGGGALDARGAR
jgi:hypothetical protein